MERVKAKLEQDVKLGITERVPIGVLTVGQARMHEVIKSNSKSCRMVDLRHVNTHSLRETEHIVPPYKQA
jgi:hypothetical protein